jgi:diaminopropionate ammonia-lyase
MTSAPMFMNPRRRAYQPRHRDLIGRAHAVEALAYLAACPAHRPTALLSLAATAAETGVAAVFIKAEWDRMGLGAFKALGGAYAVARLVAGRARRTLDRAIAPADLASPPVRAIAEELTVACASAGNHGLAVAAGARAFGAQAVVFLNQDVAESFASRLRDRGAEVVRAGSTYEESLDVVVRECALRGWDLVSDAAASVDDPTPLNVLRGYTVLFEEAAEAMEAAGGPASHVFLQAGLGGLAAAGAAYLRERWGEAFRLVVVEPEGAPCLEQSARAGRIVTIEGAPTRLGRLDCKTPSPTAFALLSDLADAFVLVCDAEAERAARRLGLEGAPASACGAVGAAGLARLDDADRSQLGLGLESRVLLVGSEAAGA